MKNINIVAAIFVLIFAYISYDKYHQNQQDYERVRQKELDNRKGPKRKSASIDKSKNSKSSLSTSTISNVTNPSTSNPVSEKKVVDQTKFIFESSQELDNMYLCYTYDSFCRFTQNIKDIRGEKIRLYGDMKILEKYYNYSLPNFTDKELENIKSVYGIDPYSDFESVQALMILSYKMNNGLIVMKKDEYGNSKPHDKTYDNIDLNQVDEVKACYTQINYCNQNKAMRKVNEKDKLFILSVLKKQLNDMITGNK